MKALGRSRGRGCGAGRWIAVAAALAVGAGFLPAAGAARPAAGEPLALAATEAGRAPAVKVLWGRQIAHNPLPQPGQRTRLTENVVILERAGEYYREVVWPRNVRVTCAVTYSHGLKNVVKRMQVPGAWRSHVSVYGGDGEARCGPWTVWKGALGLYQSVTARLVYRGTTHRGPVSRVQVLRKTGEPTSAPVPVSFLPRAKAGSIYPTLGAVAFGAPVSELWRSFGKPPQSTCTASQGLVCNWRTAVDEVHVSGSGMENYGGLNGGVVPFTRVLVSTKNLSRTKLQGWTTPDGIHIGSPVADVKRLVETIRCSRNQCEVVQPRLHRAGDARYRFNVAFTLDGRASEPNVRVVGIDVTQIAREEGACDVSIGFSQPKVLQLNASCSGELTAARLEPVNGSTRLGARRDYEEWSIRPYADDGSVAHVSSNGSQSLVRSGHVDGAYRWSVGCEEPQVPVPVYCAPGRGSGTPAWQGGLLESWDLEFHGTSSVAIVDDGNGRKIPPLRFVAEFLGREPFVFVLRYAS